MAGQTIAADDIEVIIEDGADASEIDADGDLQIPQEDGGVVIQFNPNIEKGGNDPGTFYDNLVDRIGAEEGVIADELVEMVDADDQSRQGALTNYQKVLKLLGLELKEPSTSTGDSASSADGMSVVTNPMMLEACVKTWANAQAEMLPADGPCKIEDYNELDNAEDRALADDFERDINLFLTVTAAEYVPSTSRMLLWDTILRGSGIKKVYVSPTLKRPTSEAIPMQDFIVSDAETDLEVCERITHKITMRPSVLKRLQLSGFYRDIALAPASAPTPNAVETQISSIQGVGATPATRPENEPYTLYEVQCELNLPEFSKPPFAPKGFAEKGIALPFLVTIEKDSRTILSIRRDWVIDDENCTRKQMYVKYPYIPGPGFYGTGMGNLLGNSNAALTAAWRLALDAAMYANFPGGLISELGSRQNSNTFRPAPGEFTPVKTNGAPLGDMIQPFPYKDVTSGLMTLIDKITEQSKGVSGAAEVPVGEGVSNVPVGTMVAYIEQATQVMAASHKGMHNAQAREIQMIVDLFRSDPESFWKANKKHGKYWNEERLFKALNTFSLVPKSDPNIPSHIHRVMKAVALLQMAAMPIMAGKFDVDGVRDRALIAMREDKVGIVPTTPAQPAPPPLKDQAAMVAAQAKIKDAENDQAKMVFEAGKEQADTQQAALEQAGKEKVEGMKLLGDMIRSQDDTALGHREMDIKENKLGLDTAREVLGVHKTLADQDSDARGHEREDRAQSIEERRAQNEAMATMGQLRQGDDKIGLEKFKVENPPMPTAPKPRGKK